MVETEAVADQQIKTDCATAAADQHKQDPDNVAADWQLCPLSKVQFPHAPSPKPTTFASMPVRIILVACMPAFHRWLQVIC